MSQVKDNLQDYKRISTLEIGEGKRINGPVMGVDVHKRVLVVCILTEDKIIVETKINNTKKGRTRLYQLITAHQVKAVGMEATSQYHIPLALELEEKKIPTTIANPTQVKETQGKKTDRLDARRIALALRDGRLKPSVLPPREIFHLRKNNRMLLKLIQEETKIKQRLRQVFDFHDFRPEDWSKGFLKNNWTIELFYAVITTEGMISEIVDDYYPKKTSKRSKKDLERIKRITTDLIDFRKKITFCERQLLFSYLTQLIVTKNLIEQHRLLNYQFCQKYPQYIPKLKILLTIPGIGIDSAFIILAEIVDIQYFSQPEKLVKWAGLAPRVSQSADKKPKNGKIHKGGNKHVRRVMCLICSNIYARSDNYHPIYAFIKNKYQQTGKFWLAICAGARKLLTIIWYLLQKNESWELPEETPENIIAAVNKTVNRKITLLSKKIARLHHRQKKLLKELTKYPESHHLPSTNALELLSDLLKVT